MLDEVLKRHEYERQTTEEWLLSYSDLLTNLFVFFAFLLSISVINRYRLETVTNYFKKQPKYSLMELKKKIDAMIEKHALQKKITTSIGFEGLEIDFSHSLLFKSGESILLESAKPHILTFIEELRTLEPKWRYIVEGHTDNVPIHTSLFPSNWELSAYRGMEFLNFLRTHGVDEKRIQLRGYAHTEPKVSNEDEQGVPIAENQATNRRVTLKIY